MGRGAALLTYAFCSALLPWTPWRRWVSAGPGGLCPHRFAAGGRPAHCCLCPQLTASNHVSSVSAHFNVTVEPMQRMRGLRMSAVPPVLAPNATLALAAHVLVDSAVEVAFL